MLTRKNIRNLSDEELILLYKQKKNELLIGELYHRYYGLVYGVCLKYLQNIEEAQDVSMDVFEKIPQDILKYEITSFKPWLYTKVKNDCFLFLRSRKISIEINENSTSYEPDFDSTFIKEQEEISYLLLEKAIADLKEDQAKCIRLFYLQKESYKSIEELTGMTYKEIKTAIQNGKRMLKVLMENNPLQ